MALTRSSVLHYWDALYGPNPIVGGDPVHTRDSARGLIDRARFVRTFIRNQYRTEWVTINGIRRPAMLLEPARTQRMTFSRDYTQWTNSNVTVTAGQRDPEGGLNASLLEATGAGGQRFRTVTLVGDGTKAVGWMLRKGSGAVTSFGLWDATAVAWRHLIDVNWSAAGVSTVVTQVGAGLIFVSEELYDGFYLIAISADGAVAANTNQAILYPGGTAGAASVYAFDVQIEDAVWPSRSMPSTSAVVTSAADLFYWKNPPAPQGMAIYLEMIYGVAPDAAEHRIFQLSETDSDPRLVFYRHNVTTDAFQLYLHNGTNAAFVTPSVAPVRGDRLQFVCVLHSTGAIRLIWSKNGGAAASDAQAAPGGGLPAAWQGTPRLWLNSLGSAGISRNHYISLKALKLADFTNQPGVASDAAVLSEVDNFVLGPSGEVI